MQRSVEGERVGAVLEGLEEIGLVDKFADEALQGLLVVQLPEEIEQVVRIHAAFLGEGRIVQPITRLIESALKIDGIEGVLLITTEDNFPALDINPIADMSVAGESALQTYSFSQAYKHYLGELLELGLDPLTYTHFTAWWNTRGLSVADLLPNLRERLGYQEFYGTELRNSPIESLIVVLPQESS